MDGTRKYAWIPGLRKESRIFCCALRVVLWKTNLPDRSAFSTRQDLPVNRSEEHGQVGSSPANFSSEIKSMSGRWLGKLSSLFCFDQERRMSQTFPDQFRATGTFVPFAKISRSLADAKSQYRSSCGHGDFFFKPMGLHQSKERRYQYQDPRAGKSPCQAGGRL